MIRWIRKALMMVVLLFCASCGTKVAYEHDYQYRVTKEVPRNVVKAMPHVMLDAGHGGFDLGAKCQSCEEKDLCLQTTLMVRDELRRMGYRVSLTRNSDQFIPLKQRAAIANESKCQLFVSIHYNSAKNVRAEGIEIYYYPEKYKPWRKDKSKNVSQLVLKHLIEATSAKSRGVKEGNFCVIRETNMPSILIECGFITHNAERNRIQNHEYMQTLSNSIALGIDNYFNH